MTFAAAKPGHFIADGPDVVGELTVADIGLPVTASMWVVEARDVAAWLPRRERSAHKWRHAVRLVAGGPGMTGAAALAAGAAQRTGSGMVVASSPGVDDAVLAGRFPAEVVTRPLAHVDWSADVLSDIDRFGSLVIGPGLGRQAATVDAAVRTIALAELPTVVDGDGLYAIAGDDTGGRGGAPRARGCHGADPTRGRVRTAQRARPRARIGWPTCGGSPTRRDRSCSSRGRRRSSPNLRVDAYFVVDGDARLATAGTGDVLAGIIGALLAMGAPPLEAAAGGAWIHARAGAKMSPLGLVAGDLIAAIPPVLNSLAP